MIRIIQLRISQPSISQPRISQPSRNQPSRNPSRRNHKLTLALFLLALPSTLFAHSSHSIDLPPIPSSSIPRITEPLKLADFESMQPTPALQQRLAHISSFSQNQPDNGAAPTERTDVWLGYTSSTFYAVFICHDSRPKTIRAHLARRENISQDDSVSILFDPFRDHRRGVLFELNPLGVQADALWSEGKSQPDFSYDQVWDSDGRVTPDGWMVLFAIPFRSIRSNPALPGWGIVLSRTLPRNSEQDYWPNISSNITGVLPQESTLFGIEGVAASHNIQLTPYSLLHNVHTLNFRDPLAPYFSTRSLQGTAGGEAKIVVKDTIVLDATVNPDFSQIESDEPQFTINQRFPVFFPELRPFFLENANYFSTPITLLYTRKIVNPEYGVRATGKIHHTNIGLLAADDRQPGQYVADSDPLHNQRAYFSVARIAQDFAKESTVALMYADREFANTFNRAGGIDFNLRLNDKWTTFGQTVVSSTRHPDGSYSAGPATFLAATRNGHSFFFDDVVKDYSQGFQSQTGFIRLSNVRENQNHLGYTFFPKHSLLQTFNPQLNSDIAWDHHNNRLFHYTELDLAFSLPRNTVIMPLVGENSDTLGPPSYNLLTHYTNYTQNYAGAFIRSSPIPQITLDIFATHGGNPNYNPPSGGVPSVLHETYMQARLTLQPIRALTIDNTYLLDANRTARDNTFAFENQTLRTKINYQFTRAISARAIVQYDSLLANPVYTSLPRTKQVATELLLTWLPHPGTAIYLGYDSDLQNIDRDLCNRVALTNQCDLANPNPPRSTQYLNDGRQIFLKASYLFRF